MDSDSTAWKYKQNVGISSEGPSTQLIADTKNVQNYIMLCTCMAVLQL
jgi:hypothetical protein